MNTEPNILNFKPNYKLWLILIFFYSTLTFSILGQAWDNLYPKLYENINYGEKILHVFLFCFLASVFIIPIALFSIFHRINKIDFKNKKIINIRYFGLKTKIIDFCQIIGLKLHYANSSQSKFKYRIISLIVNADTNESYSFSCLEVNNFNEYLETLPKYFKFLRSENYDLTFYRYFELTDDEKKQLFKEFEKEERSLIIERIFNYSILVMIFGYIIYSILENNIESYEFKLNHLNIIPLGVILIYGIKRIIYYTKSLINEDTYMYKFLRNEINK